MIAKMQFGRQANWDKNLELISSFRNIPIMSKARFNVLESAINNKYHCLFETARRFGIRTALGVIYKSNRK
jgi:hypothetical protein